MHSALYRVIHSAVEKTLRPLSRDIREIEKIQINQKAVGDFVTSADQRTETILKKELLKARPHFGFITEESPKQIGSDPNQFWVIDPIDGTTNFMRSIPHFSISIALVNQEEIIAGYIFDPIKNECFYAEKGRGAFLNDERIIVSKREELKHTVLGTGLPFIGCTGHDQAIEEVKLFSKKTIGIRRMGAASLDLAYVAAGRYDGYWERNLKIWDIAAGLLLVQEAGGNISSLSEKPEESPLKTGHVLASNGKIHHAMKEILSQANG